MKRHPRGDIDDLERTTLIGAKAAFSIGGGVLALLMAQMVFALVADLKRQYFISGALSASLAIAQPKRPSPFPLPARTLYPIPHHPSPA